MTPTQIGILVLAFIGLALVLAVVLWKFLVFRKFRKITSAIEQPTIIANAEPFSLDGKKILPPHKSAARPSHVMALVRRKPTAKKVAGAE